MESNYSAYARRPPVPYTQLADLVYNMRHQEIANEQEYPRI